MRGDSNPYRMDMQRSSYMRKKKVDILICILIIIFSYDIKVKALPAHKRLFERRYGYMVSCNLCHTHGGGSAINPFGKDFKRSGLGLYAFTKIEDRDSDKDGIKNIAEIKNRSNPGDPESRPDRPGSWLKDIEASFIPREQLLKLFPKASYFTILEGALKQQQIKAIESRVERALTDEEKVPTFYFAFSGAKDSPRRIGLAMFVSPIGMDGKMMVGIGITLKGRIAKVIIYKGKKDVKTFDEAFLSQFVGKGASDIFKVGEDILPVADEKEISQNIATSLKIALLTMYQVFAKR